MVSPSSFLTSEGWPPSSHFILPLYTKIMTTIHRLGRQNQNLILYRISDSRGRRWLGGNFFDAINVRTFTPAFRRNEATGCRNSENYHPEDSHLPQPQIIVRISTLYSCISHASGCTSMANDVLC